MRIHGAHENMTPRRHERAGGRTLGRLAAGLCGLVATLGCTSGTSTRSNVPADRGGISVIGPQCAGVDSCLLGQVVAAENAAPLARAAVYLEREDAPDATTEADLARSVVFRCVTDEDGVFIVTDAPAGRYRLAVYAAERTYKVRGLSLGKPGTTMIPLRLPKV